MTYKGLFGKAIQRLRSKRWSGELGEFVRELADMFSSAEAIQLDGPLKLQHSGKEAPLQIVTSAEAPEKGIKITDSDGRQVTVGIGFGNKGLIANEIIPLTDYVLDPIYVDQKLRQPSSQGRVDVKSGYEVGNAGSGIPGDDTPFQPVSGIGAALASWQRYQGEQAPPGTTDKLTMKGWPLYFIRDLLGYMVTRCIVQEVRDDTLYCLIVGTDDYIEVAKDYTLQRTPWDGKTVNGYTYSYSSPTRRQVSSASGTETQVVYPAYINDDDLYYGSDSSEIYARWCWNETSVSGVYWIDLNASGRHWVAV